MRLVRKKTHSCDPSKSHFGAIPSGLITPIIPGSITPIPDTGLITSSAAQHETVGQPKAVHYVGRKPIGGEYSR
jgi:hypothetical protein